MEWLAWQHQQVASLTAGTPMLYSHAEELDKNEKVEVERVLEFLGISGHAHIVGKPVVTPSPLHLIFPAELQPAQMSWNGDVENATTNHISWPLSKHKSVKYLGISVSRRASMTRFVADKDNNACWIGVLWNIE